MKRVIIIGLFITILTAGVVFATETLKEEAVEMTEIATLINDCNPNNTEEEYLNELVEKGYDEAWLADIYRFYLTCGEDISIIKEIYDASETHDINGRHWIESAYNMATDGVHGELDLNDVIMYVSKGVSESDIEAANIMCRSGKYTIQEILDKVVSGESIESVADEIYNNEGTTVEMKARMKKHNLKKEPKIEMQVIKAEDTVSRENKLKAVGQKSIEKYDRHSVDKLYNAKKLSEERNIPMETIIDEYEQIGRYSKYIDR